MSDQICYDVLIAQMPLSKVEADSAVIIFWNIWIRLVDLNLKAII